MLLSQVFKYVAALASKAQVCINFTNLYDLIYCQNRFVTIEVSFLHWYFYCFVFSRKKCNFTQSQI